MTDAPPVPIHQALAQVSRAVVAVGKDAKNERAGYAARSIDGVLDMIHGPLADAGVILMPNVTDHVITERTTRSGGLQYHVALWVDFTFYGPAGDHLTVRYPGEATDTGDKATTKALSQALKAALIQTFTIPVNGDDLDTHEPDETVQPQATPAQIAALAERIGVLWARIGRTAYPDAWKALRIPPIPVMRERGATAADVTEANRILDGVMTGIEDRPAEEGGGDDTPLENPPLTNGPAPGGPPGPCPECGIASPAHAPGCSMEPF